MKKILFVTNCLITGGVEKSLLQLVKSIDKKKYDITIAVKHNGGELQNEFQKIAKIKEIPFLSLNVRSLLYYYIKKCNYFAVFNLIFWCIRANLSNDYMKSCFYLSKIYPSLEEQYDIVICYHKPTDILVTYAINNVVARQKILWIHAEVDENEINSYLKIYSMYDKIFVVSKSLKKSLIRMFPELKNRVFVFYNILDETAIKNLSQQYEPVFDRDKINIVTVGRLSDEKGQYIIPKVVKKLVSSGYDNFTWYLVGDGCLRESLMDSIKRYSLEKYIILCGNLENPYPYIKKADLYVQTSLQEGYCLTVKEAIILKKKIVVTNFLTAAELITENVDGLIVDFSEQELTATISEFFKSKVIKYGFEYNNVCFKRNIDEELDNIFCEVS